MVASFVLDAAVVEGVSLVETKNAYQEVKKIWMLTIKNWRFNNE